MAWPQWTWVVLTLVGLGISMARHGEERTKREDAVSAIIATALVTWLMYLGGFFEGGTKWP